MSLRLAALDNTIGDIGLLQQRLAMIRTWTYAAFRPDWLENPELWRETTRTIEDRLSDALHDALTLRFVDRRTTALIAGLKREDILNTDVSEAGEVTIEGHVVGKLVENVSSSSGDSRPRCVVVYTFTPPKGMTKRCSKQLERSICKR